MKQGIGAYSPKEKNLLSIKSYNPGHEFLGHLLLCKCPPLLPSTKSVGKEARGCTKTQGFHYCEGGGEDASKCLNNSLRGRSYMTIFFFVPKTIACAFLRTFEVIAILKFSSKYNYDV